jgi:hypothetical protein
LCDVPLDIVVVIVPPPHRNGIAESAPGAPRSTRNSEFQSGSLLIRRPREHALKANGLILMSFGSGQIAEACRSRLTLAITPYKQPVLMADGTRLYLLVRRVIVHFQNTVLCKVNLRSSGQ